MKPFPNDATNLRFLLKTLRQESGLEQLTDGLTDLISYLAHLEDLMTELDQILRQMETLDDA